METTIYNPHAAKDRHAGGLTTEQQQALRLIGSAGDDQARVAFIGDQIVIAWTNLQGGELDLAVRGTADFVDWYVKGLDISAEEIQSILDDVE